MPEQQNDLPLGGDALITEANALTLPKPEEKMYVNNFQNSYRLIKQKAQQDPDFAKNTITKLNEISSRKNPEELETAVRDAADNIKIEFLKQQKPELFNSPSAAIAGFVNSSSFGQLSKIWGYADEQINGVPFEQSVVQHAEELRLLSKAYPKSDIAGNVASFLIPLSPVAQLFGKALSLSSKATKIAGPMMERMSRNPEFAKKVFQSTLGGAMGAAAVEGVKGTLGEGLEEFSPDRGVKDALSASIPGGFLGALVPVAGKGIRNTLESKTVREAVIGATNTIDDVSGRLVKSLTGTDAGAIRAFNKNPVAVKGALNKEAEIGERLVNLVNSDASRFIEVKAAKKLLPDIGEVDVSTVIGTLTNTAKKLAGADPELRRVVSGPFQEWVKNINAIAKNGRISAVEAYRIKEQLQENAKRAFGQTFNKFTDTMYLKASRDMRIAIEKAALETGDDIGLKYVQNMRLAQKKVSLMKFIGKKLGSNAVIQMERSEGFTKNMFGANKKYLQGRMAELDNRFGTNFVDNARMSQRARQLGESGVPELLPTQTTGRSSLGIRAGGALGSAIGGVTGAAIAGPMGAGIGAGAGSVVGGGIGAIASSPKVASVLLGASDNISGFTRQLFQNPEVLQIMSGKLSKIRPKNSERSFRGIRGEDAELVDSINKEIARIRIPIEVRRIAQEIENSLSKDGPMTATGFVRVAADSPYFIGLVHVFDSIEQRVARRERRKSIADMMKDNGNEISVAPQ